MNTTETEERLARDELLTACTLGGSICAACDGTGENRSPTTSELVLALSLELAWHAGRAATVWPNPALCRECYGEGFILPALPGAGEKSGGAGK